MKLCKNCNEMFDDNMTVCPECGTELEREVSSGNREEADAVCNTQECHCGQHTEKNTKPGKARLAIIAIIVIAGMLLASGVVLYNHFAEKPIETISNALDQLLDAHSSTVDLSLKGPETGIIGGINLQAANISETEQKMNVSITATTDTGTQGTVELGMDRNGDDLVLAMDLVGVSSAGYKLSHEDYVEAFGAYIGDDEATFDSVMTYINDYLMESADIDLNEHMDLEKFEESFTNACSKLETEEALETVWGFEKTDEVTYTFKFDLIDIINRIFSELDKDIFVVATDYEDIKKSLDDATAEMSVDCEATLTIVDGSLTDAYFKMSIPSESADTSAIAVECEITVSDINETTVEFSDTISESMNNAQELTTEELLMLVESLFGNLGGISTDTEDVLSYAQDVLDTYECEDGTVIVFYNDSFDIRQYVIENGEVREVTEGDPYYDVYLNYEPETSYLEYGGYVGAIFSDCKPREDLSGKKLENFTKAAKTAYKDCKAGNGKVSDGAYIVVYNKDYEEAVFIVEDGTPVYVSFTEERYYALNESYDYWCTASGKTKSSYEWYVYELDELCSTAYNDCADAHEAITNAGGSIENGTVYIWYNGEDKYIFEFEDGAMMLLMLSEEEEIRDEMQLLDTKDIENISEKVEVFVEK